MMKEGDFLSDVYLSNVKLLDFGDIFSFKIEE